VYVCVCVWGGGFVHFILMLFLFNLFTIMYVWTLLERCKFFL